MVKLKVKKINELKFESKAVPSLPAAFNGERPAAPAVLRRFRPSGAGMGGQAARRAEFAVVVSRAELGLGPRRWVLQPCAL